MLPEKFKEVLTHEGVASIATQGESEPHIACTWNSYIQLVDDEYLIYPAGGMNQTEENVKRNNNVAIAVGTREVEGLYYMGTGFTIKGTAEFITSGAIFDDVKEKFPWARAAVRVKIGSVKQTL